MNRRSLLRGLLAIPLAPLVAKLLPRAFDIKQVARVVNISLLDLARQSERQILPVVEALSQRNRFLEDMVWHEGNMEIGYRVSYAQRMPTKELVWRRIT